MWAGVLAALALSILAVSGDWIAAQPNAAGRWYVRSGGDYETAPVTLALLKREEEARVVDAIGISGLVGEAFDALGRSVCVISTTVVQPRATLHNDQAEALWASGAGVGAVEVPHGLWPPFAAGASHHHIRIEAISPKCSQFVLDLLTRFR